MTKDLFPELPQRVSQPDLHERLILALGLGNVRWHSDITSKPLAIDLAPPLPQRLRVYLYSATRPPGGRPLGEHKIQLMVPGQDRDGRGDFDHSEGRLVLLAGYVADEDVFVLWDAGLYIDFAWSRNVQVKAETIIAAAAGKIATQVRRLRPTGRPPAVETVVAARADDLIKALHKRMELTRERLMQE